ncbi:hypothetical protein PHLCEN_2v8689 [Hermanssonia centrifuga]|uniref:AB hydrolase-1 domain-containing protein n=1 Tax=Hermanssonia centrifuga TaxID=98765 RepID=A0A2R6NSZ2_9APHY|nr:hypothetical protein PHLCEN_2v8689 [Hermanssonia centrifuga]
MASSAALQCLVLVLPAVVIVLYVLTAFPHTPESLVLHPSLSSLPHDCRSWQIYPDDFFDGGAYAAFPLGRVRYWLLGPQDGSRVRLISIPPSLLTSVPGRPHPRPLRPFHHLARRRSSVGPQRFPRSGIRCVVLPPITSTLTPTTDLYGRGYSDAPQTTYDVSLYVTQLALLLQYIGWEKANLAGISMGGAVAAAFAVQFPHLVTGSIALMATTGIVDPGDLSRTSRFLSSPLMQIITSSSPFRLYLKHLANNDTSIDDPFSELIRIQSAHLPGYNPAIASSIRDGPIRNLAPVFAQLGRQTRKSGGSALIIWGTDDGVVPYRYAKRVQTLIPEAQLVTLQGAKHDLTVTHPEDVVNHLSAFFKEVG